MATGDHLQFCDQTANRDITGDWYAAQDATEVRAWSAPGTCLGAVELTADGWHACASDITDWTAASETAYPTWQEALAALLALAGETIPEDCSPWIS
jgi:hypothetical protein